MSEDMPLRGYGVRQGDYKPNKILLYVLEADKWIKIGLTRDIHKRLASIAGNCPLPVSIIAYRSINCDRASRAERMAHRLLRAYHHRGEWFICDHVTAISAADVAWRASLRSPEDWDAVSAEDTRLTQRRFARSGYGKRTIA